MSFNFTWPIFSAEFLSKAREQMSVALSNGKKPENIVDEIKVTSLQMGTKPPELEILEIGELTQERFKGIFKLVYQGDASVVVQTKVQANPLATPTAKRTLSTSQGK
jgi:mitochondrial distribution and morphology protein 34